MDCSHRRTLSTSPKHPKDNDLQGHDSLAFSKVNVGVDEQLWEPLFLAQEAGHIRRPYGWVISPRHETMDHSYVLFKHIWERDKYAHGGLCESSATDYGSTSRSKVFQMYKEGSTGAGSMARVLRRAHIKDRISRRVTAPQPRVELTDLPC